MKGNDLVCCTDNAVARMVDGFRTAEGVFGRCQSCILNMMKSICSFTCAPDQSRYMIPTIRTDFLGCRYTRNNFLSNIFISLTGIDYVESVAMNMDEDYINATYESCKSVIHPASGRVAMDLACGQFTSKTCSPKRFINGLL